MRDCQRESAELIGNLASMERTTAPQQSAKPPQTQASTATRGLDCSNIDLLHLHHRVESALGGGGVGIVDRLGQGDRGDLPGYPPFVLAPAAGALLTSVPDDRVPVAIRLGLIIGRDLK